MKYESFWIFCAATSVSLAVVAGAASAAFAQGRAPVTVTGARTNADQLSVQVSYRDLNLAIAAGERTLNRRVGSATRDVCMPLDFRGVAGNQILSSCLDFAWDGARPQIARAVLRAREIASTGTSAIPMVAITIAVPN